jgi:hypothetical protein
VISSSLLLIVISSYSLLSVGKIVIISLKVKGLEES